MKRMLALLLAGCLILSLAACGTDKGDDGSSSSSSSQPQEKPEIPEDAVDVPEYGIAAVLPETMQSRLGTLLFVDSYGGYQQGGVTVTGSLVFLFQSEDVYARVLDLQETGNQLTEEEYLALSLQTREFALVANLPTESVTVFLANGGDLYTVTGYQHNELLKEENGNSYYFCYDDLDTANLSESSAAIYTAIWNELPQLKEGLILYTPDVDPAHPFTGAAAEDFQGNVFTSEDFKSSQLTVLNIWATYCSPCIDEMPELEQIYQAYKDKGVNVVGVCSDLIPGSNRDLADQIVETTGVTYRNLVPDSVFLRYLTQNIQSVPTTLFIDAEGRIVETMLGRRNYDKFAQTVDRLLADQAE